MGKLLVPLVLCCVGARIERKFRFLVADILVWAFYRKMVAFCDDTLFLCSIGPYMHDKVYSLLHGAVMQFICHSI